MENEETSIDIETGKVDGDRGPWRFAMIGCSVTIVFVIAAVAVVILLMSRNPFYIKLAECRNNMHEVGAALGRYATKNDVYPDKLADLVPDYIPAAKLHCPADKAGGDHSSYVYFKRSIDDPERAILLECRHHKPKKGEKPAVLLYRKNGTMAGRIGN